MAIAIEKKVLPKIDKPEMFQVTLKLTNGEEITVFSALKQDKDKGFIKGELDSGNNKIYTALRADGEVKVKYVDQASQNFLRRFGNLENFD
jgi:hypothetical protein